MLTRAHTSHVRSNDEPTLCSLGLPTAPPWVLHGWHPCSCGGHRYISCRHPEHGHTYSNEFRYVPPIDPEFCQALYGGRKA